MDFPEAPQQPPSDATPEQTEFLNQPQQHRPNPIFYGENGLRAGWRILIYFSLAFLLYGLELIPVSFFLRVQQPYSVSAIILGEAMMFSAAFGAALLMSRIEDRPSGSYGLPLRTAFGKRFWQGAALGLGEITFIVGVLALLRVYAFGNLSFHGIKILEWGALWFAAAILIGLSEEFLFRGYLQSTLADGIGFWPAALILSLLFGCVHLTNHGENWIGVANIFLTGLVWAFSLRRTGTLWFAVGWHAAFDFGESFLYSVPDSGGVFEGHFSNATIANGRTWLTGGAVGPEASVFAFLTQALCAVLIHFWFPVRPKATTDN